MKINQDKQKLEWLREINDMYQVNDSAGKKLILQIIE